MKNGLKDIFHMKWALVLYDFVLFLAVDTVLYAVYWEFLQVNWRDIFINSAFAFGSVLICRLFGNIYKQIWRYGGIQCYIRLIITDAFASVIFVALEYLLCRPLQFVRLRLFMMVALMSVNLLLSLTMRMMYRFCFKCGNDPTPFGKVLRTLLKIFAHIEIQKNDDSQKIKIAIVGAGAAGVSLAEDLMNNAGSAYMPRCFIDGDSAKGNREIHGIPVLAEDEDIFETLRNFHIQEIVIAIPSIGPERRKQLYDFYKESGCKIKTYDYPSIQTMGARPQLREFDIEDLLFRKQIQVSDEKTKAYFQNKVVLITGGGGSIGSELCRQLSKMNPKQIIILDIYENGVYGVQQELSIKYKGELDLRIEIASITNKPAMARVFEAYHPDVVINAAAHKHVPLMEHNCIEAVENNVFGTKVVLELCEEYGTERFMMVSTDKAVNPTNVMGATKRMCEMIAQAYSTRGNVKCSCTRFGNVLGSAGSVIPLFKKQILTGGPITLTDKRIIRYFMTIPEASQLVLQSGAMANNGELFVLDMGQPVKIYDLAKSMIALSGVGNIEIVETGLRSGEKLYEELLVKTEELDTTDNELIFIERETPVSFEDVEKKLEILKNACETGDDDTVREALRSVVPTFKTPEEVNRAAAASMEMQIVKNI